MSLVQVSIAHNKEKRNEGRSDIFVLIFFTWIVKEVDPFPFRSFLNPDVGGDVRRENWKFKKIPTTTAINFLFFDTNETAVHAENVGNTKKLRKKV